MTQLTASARLKVKKDTRYLPDPHGAVYFKHNSGSFRIKGASIDQWIEKLLPMFNGDYTLGELTNGLSVPYKNRVYEIADMLYQHGFVRNVEKDRPHQLESGLLQTYAPQIEFIESFKDSGAYRFQLCRETKVLVLGALSCVVPLIQSLAEAGFVNIYLDATDQSEELKTAIEKSKQKDDAKIEMIPNGNWREAVPSMDWILYVGEGEDSKNLRELETVCKQEQKGFFPAVCLKQVGLLGPVIPPDSSVFWEAAWRRVHRSALHENRESKAFCSAGTDILTNVLSFELFKMVTGLTPPEKRHEMYLLDFKTLEGAWYPFLDHPLINFDGAEAELLEDIEEKAETKHRDGRLFQLFSDLTSTTAGIFHLWEEKHVKQLPLSQCIVQAADPLSSGPAELLPETVCAGLTHEEARRDAGLTGIEMYMSRLAGPYLKEIGQYGIGAGETLAEGVSRGMQICLDDQFTQRQISGTETIKLSQLGAVKDTHAAYYLETLSMMHGTPALGIGEDVFGFPVVWAGVDDLWYGSPGLNLTLAFREALKRALMDINPLQETAVVLQKNEMKLEIPAFEDPPQALKPACQNIKRSGLQLFVYDLPAEPFLQENLAGIYAVRIKKEEA
ncbi:putative thiazole-containing bacteriocin maturation protein [Bacillus sonorensis]|uniref:putative thiazole-containing bacteriocin maturation protein n=1 Tax=Bacillus sonorensis TaxID=119858 RepID=UPI00098AE2DF|nr:putative thiazole-containing bacteriocin maturation protein [Bacillus sonorensis]